MSSVKTVLHPKKDKDGEIIHRLAIRVTIDRKTSYLHLGQNIDPKHWNAEKNNLKTSHLKYAQINRQIRKKKDLIEDIIFDSDAANIKISAKQVISLAKNNKEEISFFTYAEEFLKNLEKTDKYKRAKSDRSRLNRILDYHSSKDLSFKEIDESFLRKLRVYLISYHKLTERTVMNVFVFIRTIYNQAIKDGIALQENYPFGKNKVRIKYPDTIKIGLDDFEIKKIEELNLKPGTTIHHTRNVFLFSFYLAGIRISDVLEMRWSSLQNGRLQYQMRKNNKVDSLKLPEKALAIINQYKIDKNSINDYIFPELKKAKSSDPEDIYRKTNTAISKFNKHLKKIAELAEINKKITTHIARHSFGNIAGDKISPQMLQKLYRHSHLTTTIGYQGNFIHKDADEALDNVLDF